MKEFLDLEQEDHSVFDYMWHFNTIAQYGSYHVDTYEKKANLYRAGLTIHQQERLIHFTSLLYNELASAAIDQERVMKEVAKVDEKKRKKMMPGSAGSGSPSGAPLSHPVLRPKLDALPFCVPGSSFTHKATNSEINSKPLFNTMYLITKLITRPRGLNSGKGHHAIGR
jgi:hypothetical protein